MTFGSRLHRILSRYMPDPLTLAVGLTLLTLSAAWISGASPRQTLEVWGTDRGLWRLLRFGMQMCLILVTGHALASAPSVARGLRSLAAWPRSPAVAVALVAWVSTFACLLHWGLGLMVGAIFAREVSDAVARRGQSLDPALAAAAGYSGMMAWHAGLSGSALLKVTRLPDIERLLGGELAARVGEIPLNQTLLSPLNLFVMASLLVLAPLFFARMAATGQASFDPQPEPTVLPPVSATASPTPADRALSWVLAALLGAAWVFEVRRQGWDRLDPNAINLLFLALGFGLYGSLREYAEAARRAASGCAGIVIQFPLYAGILGVLTATPLAGQLAGSLAGVADGDSLPALTFLTAGLLNLLVPSGGGQWAIQGPVALEAALELGVAPAKMVLAVAYGDQWTNMLQPFWALPLLAITGVRAGALVGYTVAYMLVVGLMFPLLLLLF